MHFSRPEAELLFQCARTHVHTPRFQHLLQQELNWENLIDVAARNRVVTLVFQHLKEYVPDEHAPRVQRYLQLTMQQNLLLTSQLLQIMQVFQQQGIPIIPFKGPVLAGLVYKNLALREFGDLDVLIHADDLQQAKTLLESLGYKPELNLNADEEKKYIQDKHHYAFQHPAHQTIVELHWSLADSQFSLLKDEQSFWGNARWVDFQNTQILTPSDEDLLLYLCNHGYRHEWERLSWIVDVAELLRVTEDMDWGYLADQAEYLRSRQKLALGLHLARAMTDRELPRDFLEIIPLTPKLEKLIDNIWQRIFAPEITPAMAAQGMAYHYTIMETWGDRFRYYRHYVRRRLTPNREDETLVKMPAGLSFLYIFVRLFRLTRVYGLAILKTLFNQR